MNLTAQGAGFDGSFTVEVVEGQESIRFLNVTHDGSGNASKEVSFLVQSDSAVNACQAEACVKGTGVPCGGSQCQAGFSYGFSGVPYFYPGLDLAQNHNVATLVPINGIGYVGWDYRGVATCNENETVSISNEVFVLICEPGYINTGIQCLPIQCPASITYPGEGATYVIDWTSRFPLVGWGETETVEGPTVSGVPTNGSTAYSFTAVCTAGGIVGQEAINVVCDEGFELDEYGNCVGNVPNLCDEFETFPAPGACFNRGTASLCQIGFLSTHQYDVNTYNTGLINDGPISSIQGGHYLFNGTFAPSERFYSYEEPVGGGVKKYVLKLECQAEDVYVAVETTDFVCDDGYTLVNGICAASEEHGVNYCPRDTAVYSSTIANVHYLVNYWGMYGTDYSVSVDTNSKHCEATLECRETRDGSTWVVSQEQCYCSDNGQDLVGPRFGGTYQIGQMGPSTLTMTSSANHGSYGVSAAITCTPDYQISIVEWCWGYCPIWNGFWSYSSCSCVPWAEPEEEEIIPEPPIPIPYWPPYWPPYYTGGGGSGGGPGGCPAGGGGGCSGPGYPNSY